MNFRAFGATAKKMLQNLVSRAANALGAVARARFKGFRNFSRPQPAGRIAARRVRCEASSRPASGGGKFRFHEAAGAEAWWRIAPDLVEHDQEDLHRFERQRGPDGIVLAREGNRLDGVADRIPDFREPIGPAFGVECLGPALVVLIANAGILIRHVWTLEFT
jgi:hypothetical protein